jgi:hypothetical protein
MATKAQKKANRENSQKSTGPVTPEGQQASSQNATQHGLSSSRTFQILSDEDAVEFKELIEDLKEHYQPQTQVELDLLHRLAQHDWLRARAIRWQNLCLDPGEHIADPARFAVYLRYQTSNERAYANCLKELLTGRAETRKVEIGFVSQKRSEACDQRAEKALKLKENSLELANKQFEWKKSRSVTAETPQETPVSAESSSGGVAQAA